MDKQTLLKQKINNLIIFIKSKIPNEKNIIAEFEGYLNDMNKFLQDIIALSKYEINEENIQKYLEYKNVKSKIDKETMNKLIAYYKMFIEIVNA